MGLDVERLLQPVEPDVADELVQLRRTLDAVEEPDDPPIGAAELVADLFVERPEEARAVWLARRDRRPVGVVVAGVNVEGENAGHAEVEVDVLPDERGAGVERLLVAAATPWLRERGTRTLAWWPSDDAGRQVAEQLGLSFRQHERCSRLRTADLDGTQQDEWIAAPKARAAGYEMIMWTGACPDQLLEAYAAAYSAMADAPLDDIEWTPATVTPDHVRRSEEVASRLGHQVFAALVLAPDGSGAGMTRLDVHPDRPELGHQEDTAVVPAHRGLALGRWLKAANLRQVADTVPELAVVQTYNAETNPWMLAINVEMGFRPHRSYDAYQAPIDEVMRAVGT